MESTTDFHNNISQAIFNEANDFFDHATSLDAAVDMLDAHSALRDLTIGGFLLYRELYPARFLGGHDGGDSIECESLEAKVLHELAALW